jgi:hypothetical protein
MSSAWRSGRKTFLRARIQMLLDDFERKRVRKLFDTRDK